jgi:acetyl esterase/lipase
MKSLSYYATLLVIKMKGVKKEFRKDPIDYQKLRKENVIVSHPKKFRPFSVTQFKVGGSEVSEIKPEKESGDLIIYCHGGAFVYGPVDYHWDAVKALARQTDNVVWMINYPKAPENDIKTISDSIDEIYKEAQERYPLENVILAGDSVGGTLITALVQRLIKTGENLPSLLALISPVMDASFSNPEIEEIDNQDPILSKTGALSAKKMCAAGRPLKDPLISPLYGSFKGFPEVLMFIAENDITRPDQQLAAQKMRDEKVEVTTIFGEGMPHIWPILPVMKEARNAFSDIILKIKSLPEEKTKKPG